jgi:hypothetical protein
VQGAHNHVGLVEAEGAGVNAGGVPPNGVIDWLINPSVCQDFDALTAHLSQCEERSIVLQHR